MQRLARGVRGRRVISEQRVSEGPAFEGVIFDIDDRSVGWNSVTETQDNSDIPLFTAPLISKNIFFVGR
jgi:hypothetical protein